MMRRQSQKTKITQANTEQSLRGMSLQLLKGVLDQIAERLESDPSERARLMVARRKIEQVIRKKQEGLDESPLPVMAMRLAMMMDSSGQYDIADHLDRIVLEM